MSIFQPVNLAASLTFWPSLPIAKDNWLSSTTTLAALFSSSTIVTSITLAGLKALDISSSGNLLHFIMSIFSFLSSFTIFWTLTPLGPTQAPIGSTASSLEYTAILVLDPASLAMLFISTTPLYISGTSSSNNLFTNPGWVLDIKTCGPFVVFFTSTTYNFIFSLNLNCSPGICSFGPKTASDLPTFIRIFPLSFLKTVPVNISSSFSIYSLYTILLSSSFILCITTCFAAWAAILPNFLGVTSIFIISSNS